MVGLPLPLMLDRPECDSSVIGLANLNPNSIAPSRLNKKEAANSESGGRGSSCIDVSPAYQGQIDDRVDQIRSLCSVVF